MAPTPPFQKEALQKSVLHSQAISILKFLLPLLLLQFLPAVYSSVDIEAFMIIHIVNRWGVQIIDLDLDSEEEEDEIILLD
jgi:hypothetical protein